MDIFNIGIACDHAGFAMKELVVKHLLAQGHAVKDFGTYSEESCDYPDFAHKLGNAIENGQLNWGVALCGSANGITMTVNKHPNVRAAICWTNEITQLARWHNDANVCSLPARFITPEQAYTIVDTFFTEKFEGGRHQKRVDKINI